MTVCNICRKNRADLCYECTKELKVYRFYGKDMVEGLYYRKADVDRLIESLNTGNNAVLPDPPKPRRATNRELARWLAQGNGEYTNPKSDYYNNYSSFSYEECDKDNEIYANFKVRKWSDTEWHEPTVDYLGIDDKDYNFNKKYGEV